MNNESYQKIYHYTVVFEPAEEGGYIVNVPALPGCVTEGDSFKQAVEMAKDVIRGYLESLIEHNEPIPEEIDKGVVKTINVSISIPKSLAKKV